MNSSIGHPNSASTPGNLFFIRAKFSHSSALHHGGSGHIDIYIQDSKRKGRNRTQKFAEFWIDTPRDKRTCARIANGNTPTGERFQTGHDYDASLAARASRGCIYALYICATLFFFFSFAHLLAQIGAESYRYTHTSTNCIGSARSA